MNALSAVMYTLVNKVQVPFTATTGGTSQGNPNAGMQTTGPLKKLAPITTGDRVAAAFLTTSIVFSVLGGAIFVVK